MRVYSLFKLQLNLEWKKNEENNDRWMVLIHLGVTPALMRNRITRQNFHSRKIPLSFILL